MKIFLLFLLCGMTFCLPFKNKPVPTQPAAVTAAVSDTISFTAQIQPILKDQCSPCHFPGGKMYEKMPFDQAKTIVGHSEGILKRFKNEGENGLLRQFIAENSR